jgi:hypothetical protein
MPISGGHINFMQNQTNTIIAIVWPISVAFRSTWLLLNYDAPIDYSPNIYTEDESDLSAGSCLELGDKRIGKGKEQSNTNTNHCDRIKQRYDQKHLGL